MLIVPDLVEEQRALVRLLEPALPIADRAGERAAHMAEQLGFEQRLGNRAAVERDEADWRAADCCGESRARRLPCRCRFRRVIRIVLLVGATVSSSWNSRAIARPLADDPFEAISLLELRAQDRRSPTSAAAARAPNRARAAARRSETAC